MKPADSLLSCRTDACWLAHSLDGIRAVGYSLVTGFCWGYLISWSGMLRGAREAAPCGKERWRRVIDRCSSRRESREYSASF